jgi:hypothetical protein
MAHIEQSYRDIADQVNILGRQDPKANILKLVHDWLCDGKHGPWLLVIDNVGDIHVFLEAESAGRGVQGAGVDRGI